jgi:8-oxo-dGTP pyrophosphatase MutT (NUDIX family)
VAKEPSTSKSRKPKRSGKASAPAQKWQVAALPFRVSESGELEILLITSRETRRAVIPKGWPMKGLRDHEAAAREAYEEAGVVGKIGRKPVGSYEYWKRLTATFAFVRVDVYPLEFERQRKDWPEKGHRELAWFGPDDAALLVDEPALSTLVREFKPLLRSKASAKGSKAAAKDSKGPAKGKKAAATSSKAAAKDSKASAKGKKAAAKGRKAVAKGHKLAAKNGKAAAKGRK